MILDYMNIGYRLEARPESLSEREWDNNNGGNEENLSLSGGHLDLSLVHFHLKLKIFFVEVKFGGGPVREIQRQLAELLC